MGLNLHTWFTDFKNQPLNLVCKNLFSPKSHFLLTGQFQEARWGAAPNACELYCCCFVDGAYLCSHQWFAGIGSMQKMEDKKKKNVGRRVKLELSAHTYSHLSVSNFGQFQCLKKKKKALQHHQLISSVKLQQRGLEVHT